MTNDDALKAADATELAGDNATYIESLYEQYHKIQTALALTGKLILKSMKPVMMRYTMPSKTSSYY